MFKRFGVEIRKFPPDHNGKLETVVSLVSKYGSHGNVLLSYLNEPFLLDEGESIPNSHTNYWECWQMAETFLELGYYVDVINSYNYSFISDKNYDIFVGHRNQYERIAKMLREDCLKIAHFDTAHWLYNNFATYKRSYDLQKRRGVSVSRLSQRIIEYNTAIECADFGVVLGNDFTINTFRYARKPVLRVPISTCEMYPWSVTKNFEICRNNYLWFGSSAMVHKGLDLVLEAFYDMPEYNLTICGPVGKEDYFVQAYYKELYQCRNINTIGWIDTSSSDFVNILNNCIGLIFPSCSEGGGGSVIACMHGGLIPIVSYESSVDVGDDFGIILKNSSLEEIKSSIRKISNLPSDQLQCMARKSWEFARKYHTRDRFATEYRKAIEFILNAHNMNNMAGIQ